MQALSSRALLVLLATLACGLAIRAANAAPVRAAYAASDEAAALAASDAKSLAARIRADARRGGPHGMIAVKHLSGCCGVHALEIYERARPGHYARYGAYLLQLVTGPHRIEKVAIHEFPTHRGYNFSGEAGADTYAFDISPGHGQWRIGTTSARRGSVEYETGPHPEGFALTTARVNALYEQVLLVAQKAEHHAPLTEEKDLSVAGALPPPCGSQVSIAACTGLRSVSLAVKEIVERPKGGDGSV